MKNGAKYIIERWSKLPTWARIILFVVALPLVPALLVAAWSGDHRLGQSGAIALATVGLVVYAAAGNQPPETVLVDSSAVERSEEPSPAETASASAIPTSSPTEETATLATVVEDALFAFEGDVSHVEDDDLGVRVLTGLPWSADLDLDRAAELCRTALAASPEGVVVLAATGEAIATSEGDDCTTPERLPAPDQDKVLAAMSSSAAASVTTIEPRPEWITANTVLPFTWDTPIDDALAICEEVGDAAPGWPVRVYSEDDRLLVTSESGSCVKKSLPASPTPSPLPPPPPPPSPEPTPEPEPAPEPADNCHPSYTPCVPYASDVDCLGGSGNGPEYTGRVTVIGPDEYDLDRDGDGIGCE